MSERRRFSKLFWLAAVPLVLALLPVLVATSRTELTISAMYDQGPRVLPAKTTLLRTESSVARTSDGLCRATVARQLATELDGAELDRAIDETLAKRAPGARFAAWFEHKKLIVRRVGAVSRAVFDTPETPALPPAARQLASAYAMLPKGVRRVVVYDTRVLDEPWELRCL